MLGHYAAVNIKELTDGFLRQPNIVILHPDFDSILMGIFRKHQKIHGAITDLQLVLLSFFIILLQFRPRVQLHFFPGHSVGHPTGSVASNVKEAIILIHNFRVK